MSGKIQPVREPPNELKSIKPFVLRGNQLRNADPVITYYCFFWAVKQILANGLHTASPECTNWTSELMDELERRKEALGASDLIHDDMAAQAYVENFALKIFNNGASMVEAAKATSQTSDTLLAGATLLEVTKVFGDLEQETLQKIKFAKFHAARIWKATSQGQNPNSPQAATTLSESQHPPPPSIEEIPDESVELEPRLAQTSIYDESLHLDHQSPVPQQAPLGPQEMSEELPCPPQSPKPQEYFPPVPTVHEPIAPSLFPSTMGPMNTTFPDTSPYQQAPQPPPPPSVPAHFAPNPYYQGLIGQPPPHESQYQEQIHHISPPVSAPPKRQKEITAEDMAKAQKHARWAISALDYEDVETAIKQFKLGLQLMGVE